MSFIIKFVFEKHLLRKYTVDLVAHHLHCERC